MADTESQPKVTQSKTISYPTQRNETPKFLPVLCSQRVNFGPPTASVNVAREPFQNRASIYVQSAADATRVGYIWALGNGLQGLGLLGSKATGVLNNVTPSRTFRQQLEGIPTISIGKSAGTVFDTNDAEPTPTPNPKPVSEDKRPPSEDVQRICRTR
eukprot:1339415-Amorphochlora_amoeboformis.AAC.1